MFRIFLLSTCLFLTGLPAVAPAAANGPPNGLQTIVAPKAAEETPLVVIYTLSDCPHCREAKAYLTGNKIPFVNREVDTDDLHMAELMKLYDAMGVPEQKRGVPLFVIGNRIKLQGFNRDKLQKALQEVGTAPK
jgi:glutaredoxin